MMNVSKQEEENSKKKLENLILKRRKEELEIVPSRLKMINKTDPMTQENQTLRKKVDKQSKISKTQKAGFSTLAILNLKII